MLYWDQIVDLSIIMLYNLIGVIPLFSERCKIMKKLIVIFLALVMILSAFASCGDGSVNSSPQKTTPKAPDTPDTPGGEEVPENEQLNIDLDKINYEGDTVTIFHWQGIKNSAEFGMEPDDILNNAVNDAVYKRNLAVETELGIDIEWAANSNVGYTKTRKFIDNLETRVSDPTTPVDIIAASMRSLPFFMVEGHLTELNTYSDTLDLDKAWWPGDIQDTAAVKGNLYFVSGDIATSLLNYMTVLFVNRTRLEQIGQNYDEFMQKVKNGEWYFDDLIALTTGEWEDIDNVKGPSYDDKFGLVTVYYMSDGLYTGLGYKYMSQSTKDNEYLRLSSHIAGETAMQYVQKMKDWQATNDFFMNFLEPNEYRYEEPFVNGLALFCINKASYGFTLQDSTVKFACLPCPKLDENQKRYYTNMQGTYTGYSISVTSPDYDRAAQTVQALGYYGFKETTPAVFEVSFQGKFAKDDYNIEMFNIIRESVVFDTGKIYDYFVATHQLGFDLEYIICNVVSYGIKGNELGQDTNFNFANTADPVRKTIQECINESNKEILDFIESDN